MKGKIQAHAAKDHSSNNQPAANPVADIENSDNFIIKAENISFKYNKEFILENVSFKIRQGEYLGVVGPNGAGKTTLLKILLGLLKPDNGTVKILGKQINKLKEKHLIGYVPQKASQTSLEFPATVQEIVSSGRTAPAGLFKRFTKEDHEKIEWAIRETGLITLKNTLISNLSGGQRQKVFIARALAASPRILFLDEPTIAVDIAGSAAFYELLHKLNEAFGITIIFVSHDLDVIAREVSSVICLKKTLVCHGPPREFLNTATLEKLYGEKNKYVDHHQTRSGVRQSGSSEAEIK